MPSKHSHTQKVDSNMDNHTKNIQTNLIYPLSIELLSHRQN